MIDRGYGVISADTVKPSETRTAALSEGKNAELEQLKIEPWLVQFSGLGAGCKPKGRRFDSQLGHMPELQARSPVGAT